MVAAITGCHSVFRICFCANTFLKKSNLCCCEQALPSHMDEKFFVFFLYHMLCFKVCCMCLPVLSFFKTGCH